MVAQWKEIVTVGNKLPTGYVNGLGLSYVSATSIKVGSGKCRDGAGTIDLTNVLSTTVANNSQGIAACDGVSGPTATCGAAASTATINSDLRPTLNFRSGSGTISSSGTTITGVSTSFLTQLAVGDLIGDAGPSGATSAGWGRVASIASDTSLTLSNALPGSALSGNVYGIVENATFQLGAAPCRRVNTLSSNGLTIVTDGTLNNGSAVTNGATLIGMTTAQTSSTVAIWSYVWIGNGASGTTVWISTQRTTPYSAGLSGYTTSVRRLGAVCQDKSANVIAFFQDGVSNERRTVFDVGTFGPSNLFLIINDTAGHNGWTDVYCGNGVPPTSQRFESIMYLINPTGFWSAYLRTRGSSVSSSTNLHMDVPSAIAGITGAFDLHTDAAQYIQHNEFSTQAITNFYFHVTAFVEYL